MVLVKVVWGDWNIKQCPMTCPRKQNTLGKWKLLTNHFLLSLNQNRIFSSKQIKSPFFFTCSHKNLYRILKSTTCPLWMISQEICWYTPIFDKMCLTIVSYQNFKVYFRSQQIQQLLIRISNFRMKKEGK